MPRSLTASGGRHQKWVFVMALMILGLGVANLVRMGVAIAYWICLPSLPMRVGWAYLAGGGLFWGVTFVVCGIGLLHLRQWGRLATLGASVVYEAHVWANRLLFDSTIYTRQKWQGQAVVTALFLVYVWVFLNWRSTRKVLQ